MPGKVLWDPKMKGCGPINMELGTAWCYVSLNPSFSSEHLCNLAPFQSEHTTWGAGGKLPLKIPSVLFSEDSLFVSEAALGCCSGFLSQQNLLEQLGEAGASGFLQIHTWSENVHGPILCRAPPPALHWKPALHFPSLTPHHPRDNPKGVVSFWWWFSYYFIGNGILFSNSKFFWNPS